FDRPVHRRAGLRFAVGEEELHSHCAPGRAAAHSVRYLQHVLPGWTGGKPPGAVARRGVRLEATRVLFWALCPNLSQVALQTKVLASRGLGTLPKKARSRCFLRR